MREIVFLEGIYGYRFELRDDDIAYELPDGVQPEREHVLPLLRTIREKRDEAIGYLTGRSEPLDISEHLWDAAEKARCSALQAEQGGNLQFAEEEWRRFARLFASAAQASGAIDPLIPWSDWIAAFIADPDASDGGTGRV